VEGAPKLGQRLVYWKGESALSFFDGKRMAHGTPRLMALLNEEVAACLEKRIPVGRARAPHVKEGDGAGGYEALSPVCKALAAHGWPFSAAAASAVLLNVRDSKYSVRASAG